MDSIIQADKECYFCGSPYVECHHVFYGTANRKLSESYGMKVWLCHEHHTGNTGVHFDKAKDTYLKVKSQTVFENYYKDLSFMKIFGKNYKGEMHE